MKNNQPALYGPASEDRYATANPAPSAVDASGNSSATAASPPPQARSGGGGAGPWLISLLALAVSGVAGWQTYEQRQQAGELRAEVAQRVTAADVAVGEVRAVAGQNSQGLANLQGQFGGVDAKISAVQGQAAAIEALYREHARSRNDQVLAEVEQALNIASQQMQMAGNYNAALIALEGADARLSEPDLGHMQALRKAVIKDLDTVRAHPRVDASGLALRLENLLDSADKMPLAHEFTLSQEASIGKPAEVPALGENPGVVDQSVYYAREVAADVWEEVRGMVRLERLDQTDPALIAPGQAAFLRENLKIRLLTARLALLARDVSTYKADIAQARTWIERFFDRNNQDVARAIVELGELEKIEIATAAPSLEDSFTALRVMQSRPNAATAN